MEDPTMEPTAILEAGGISIAQLNNYGMVGTLLAILFVFAALAIWYLARHCEKRTDAAIDAYKVESASNRTVIEKNTEGFHSLQITLAKLETKLEK